MPSFWSAVAKHMANSSFSTAMPSSMSICMPRSMQALAYFTDGGVLGEGLGHLQRAVHEGLGGVDGVDKADLFRLVGLDHLAGEDQFLGLGHAHAAGQALGAGEAGGDAQTHLRLAELGLFGGQDDVAAEGQLAAAA